MTIIDIVLLTAHMYTTAHIVWQRTSSLWTSALQILLFRQWLPVIRPLWEVSFRSSWCNKNKLLFHFPFIIFHIFMTKQGLSASEVWHGSSLRRV